MKSFINVEDIGDLSQALAEAQEIKNERYKYQHLGKNKTLMMIFFNNSLRTRLSTQKAAMNMGMNVIVLDVNAGAWKLDFSSSSSTAAVQSLRWKQQPYIRSRLLPILSPSKNTKPCSVLKLYCHGHLIAVLCHRPYLTALPNG